jgi:TRAP-type C4-dicarboxylate transport system permease small subunit
VVFALLLAFFVFMLIMGIRYSIFAGQTTAAMEIPVGAVYLAMPPVGFCLLIAHALIMMRGYVRESSTG